MKKKQITKRERTDDEALADGCTWQAQLGEFEGRAGDIVEVPLVLDSRILLFWPSQLALFFLEGDSQAVGVTSVKIDGEEQVPFVEEGLSLDSHEQSGFLVIRSSFYTPHQRDGRPSAFRLVFRQSAKFRAVIIGQARSTAMRSR